MATSTPLGTVMGSRPILDIAASPLPDVGEDFAAHAALVGLLVGQQPAGRRDDRDAQAAQDLGQVVLLRVNPQTRLGHALDARDRALARVAVLEGDHELLAHLGVVDAPAGDVALLLEDLGDVGLDLRVRHGRRVVVRGVRVTQTGQHVCDRVGHRHGLVALLAVVSCGPAAWSVGAGAPGGSVWFSRVRLDYQLDLVMPGSSPRCAMERKHTRQRPNLRYTARGRPQRVQRVYPRTANLGFRFALTISAVFATVSPP